MRDLYQAFAEARKLNKKRGFTLIELLVVIAIIAILAAIAIPQFAKYRTRAYNAAAESDLRTIRTTMEAIYADYQAYGNQDQTVGPQQSSLTIQVTNSLTETISLSTGVYGVVVIGSNQQAYTAGTGHQGGNRVFCADSDLTAIYYKDVTGSSLPIDTADLGDIDSATINTNDCDPSTYTNQL